MLISKGMKNLFPSVRKLLFKRRDPRVLAIVNHYFGEGGDFRGKSTTSQNVNARKKIVKKAISALSKIPNIEIKVCGIKGCSLIDIDKNFSHLENPSFLVYETIEWMVSQLHNYDYFINIEDDILLDRETFYRIKEFDEKNLINECFHPNRVEYRNGREYCVDLEAMPGWTHMLKKYKNYNLRVALNPHSGISCLSKEKLAYAKRYVDFARRDIIIGHYMASAYANLHSPFILFRSFPDLSLHKVIHLDNWKQFN